LQEFRKIISRATKMSASARKKDETFRRIGSRSKVLSVLIALLLALIAAYAWLNSPSGKIGTFSGGREQGIGVEAHGRMAASHQRIAHIAESMAEHSSIQGRDIDFSMPLYLQLNRLSLAADRGDTNAICKLVKSLEHCKGIDRMVNNNEVLLAALSRDSRDKKDAEEMVDEVIQYENDIQKAQAFCSDLNISIESELTKRLLQAADHGDIGALERLAFDPPLTADAPLSVAETMLLYRRKAPEFLSKLAFYGDMNAIKALYEAHSSGVISTQFGDVPVERDSDLLAAVADVLVELGDAEVRGDVSERIASGAIRSAILTSRRSVQLRDKLRKSIVDATNRKPPHQTLGVNHQLLACG
jgi:hypothetical protein